ncbi:MAG: pantetheine-phosphate adenylyltransferase [Clostridiales Family XIII bacterium]|jgi:pantetheine-phosphate adenylyltransferase|nr:pantetheine-phosphate adenylyltransferase [Clostridiales Family XIII bacterium]
MNAGRMLYAGTFDPVTSGHLDVIRRAASLADELIVGVLTNTSKRCYFTVEERFEMLRAATAGIAGVTIGGFGGLLADYVKETGVVAVVRGLRATTDFEYEIQMAQMNARLTDGITETIFLMTDPKYSFVSSSLIKEVFILGGDIRGLVPDEVLDYMTLHRKENV